MRQSPRGVIAEGPDCSGKTTIIKHLKAQLSGGWDVLQMGHKRGDQFKRYMKVYLEADRLLLDRSHFSEVVYGDLWRKGRHFAPWERALLDDIAREEFVTVLCTSPPDILRARYMSRNLEQVPISDEEIARAQARFVETVTPHSAFVFDTHPLESFSFEDAARVIVDRLEPAGPQRHVSRTTLDEVDPSPGFIILEGALGSSRSTVAKLLTSNLAGWHVTTLDHGPDRAPFRRFMASYLAADKTIFDGGHFTAVITGNMSGDGRHFTADEWAYLRQYVASRGLVVLCESSLPVGARFHDVLKRSNVPYYNVRTDDTESVAAVTNVIAGRVLESVAAIRGETA